MHYTDRFSSAMPTNTYTENEDIILMLCIMAVQLSKLKYWRHFLQSGLHTFTVYQIKVMQGSYGILNTFFKDFSRTFPGQFMSFQGLFTIIVKHEMVLKASSNTAGGLGVAFSPHQVQERVLVEVLGAKPPEAPEILHLIVLENGIKIHIFPVCFSSKTQEKVIEIATQSL